MTDKKRYYVGLMIHHLENEYASEVLKGAISAAEELDINLILLPGRGINAVDDDEKYSIYDYQYNVIYNYVSSANLDALIVSAGTIGSYISHEEMIQFLRGFKNLPVLTMEVEYPGYPCIHFNPDAMKLAVDHLIEDCGCKKIGFVSGPRGNDDAMTRLECYKTVMEEHGLPYDDSLIGYGNFSENSEDVVRAILDANPDIEAICFANDKMCVGGYNVFQERNLRVGKDILVTGFDDSEVATSLKPMLTSIRTNLSEMGYRSIYSAYEMLETNHACGMNLEARLVVRESCCSSTEENIETSISRKSISAQNVAARIFNKYIGDVQSLKKTRFINDIWKILADEIDALYHDDPVDAEYYSERFNQIFSSTENIPIQISLLKKIFQHAKNCALQICRDNTQHQLAVEQIYNAQTEALLDYSIQQQYRLRTSLSYSNFLISNINKDMMVNCNDEDQSYYSIINNLQRVNFKSSYVYVFKEPVVHYQYNKWIMPDILCLKSYHNGKELQNVYPPNQEIPTMNCICNKYIPKNRRFTFIMVPLFSNEEQYGLLVCELEPSSFSQIYSASPQICSAIKLTRLVKKLEGSLEAAEFDNKRLKRISDSDELTGAYNRRGFYHLSNMLMTAEESVGKEAVLLLADLDNLKKINDTFGHNDGDHAIKMCIQHLTTCVPMLDVIGRIGGDEFAAFVMVPDADKAIKEIYASVKKNAADYNAISDKPYNITVSLGLHKIICGTDETIQNFVKFADAELYEDKKKKNTEILKDRI